MMINRSLKTQEHVTEEPNSQEYLTYLVIGLMKRGHQQRHDLAVLITNSNLEWEGGLAHAGGACFVDRERGFNWGSAVWSDNGQFRSILTAVQEIEHT